MRIPSPDQPAPPRDARPNPANIPIHTYKSANLAGGPSECNGHRHYDGHPASPTARARGGLRERANASSERRKRRIRRAVRQSAIDTATLTDSPLRRQQELAASLEMAGRGFH